MNKLSEQLIGDIVKINNDRIACYQAAVDRSERIDADLRSTLSSIIAEAKKNKAQLALKFGQPEADVHSTHGRVYRAWADLKVALVSPRDRIMLSSCLFYEEITLQAYEAARSSNACHSEDIALILEEQQNGIRKSYDALKGLRRMRQVADTSLAFFA